MTLRDNMIAALAAVEVARTALATIDSNTASAEGTPEPATNIKASIGRAREELTRLEAMLRTVKESTN
jgi:hypothetical protein